MSKLRILLVVAGALSLCSVVRADTVEYSTSGYFGAPTASSVTSSGESLTYAGVSNVFVNTPSTVSFGDFTPTFGGPGTTGSFTGDTFTLVITELTNGSSSSQSITGVLSGGLSDSTGGSPSSNVFVNFNNQSVNFANANGNTATYTPYSTPLSTEDTTVQGGVSSATTPVTPLPKSVYGTAGLIGLAGLRRFGQRLFAA